MKALLFCLTLMAAAAPAAAQSRAVLRVTVVDQTGAAIVGASVGVARHGEAAIELTSDTRGQAVASNLATGAAVLKVEAAGFAPQEIAIDLRRGGNSRTVTLRIASLKEELVVTDKDGADRSGHAFTTTLNEEELAEMPDDADEFEDVLRQMAGGEAVFQVNGFRGGRLPPKNQIRQIRFRINAYSADNHSAGHTLIDVVTKPGTTAWRGNANLALRDDVLNARNAFAGARTPEQFRRFSGNIFGPLQKERTSLFFTVEGNASYDSQTIVAQTPDRRVAEQVRRPVDRAEVTVGLEHALTKNQTLRFEYQRRGEDRRNLGVGDFSLADRAFSRKTTQHQVRASSTSVIGRSALNELRVQFRAEDALQQSLSSAPAVVVIDAFTTGGAGVASDRALTSLEVADDLDFTLGKHAMRAGLLLEAGAYRLMDGRNANGTFTFGSLEAYLQGRPNTYTQRLGSVETAFSQYQVGAYLQDDFKVNKNLSLSAGVRHEVQNHVGDWSNVMPRAGFSWNPFGAKTTIRGGYGLFHDWLSAELYDQSLRVNGVAQRDLLILAPGYPDPFAGASAQVLPGGVVRLAPDLELPSVHQVSIGAERTFFQTVTVQASYMRQDGDNQLRSVNVNAPDTTGARRYPDVGTIAQLESTGRLESRRLTANVNLRLPNRTMLGSFYVLSSTKNHADTPLSLPADSRDPDAEWGPSAQDARHRLFTIFNFPLPKGVRGSVMSQMQSGLPYTIITGGDDNGDGVSNDRPAGVGRNSARGAWRWDLNARISRGFGFGGEREAAPGGGPVIQRRVGGDGDGGGGPMMMMMEASSQCFRVDFYVQGYNLLNRTNLLSYSGNLQSPFFGSATSAGPARRVELGMQFAF